MPNIINADDGVISGVAGIKTSADTSGVLNIQTNGTTAISISTAQVVSLTNSPTFTGGTANGVLYLNGSKVATSGSALTFDGTNLGVGVTPSAWSGVGAALQVGLSAVIIGNSVNSSSFISNAYFDGTNYRYIGTGFAQRLALTSGAYSFQTAASGTAGSAITFTTGMTLDASGNLGIGTASPGARLEAYRNSSGEVARFTAAADGVRSLKFISSDNTGSGAVWTRDIDSAFAQHRWAKSGTPLMVLDESGNLGIGTASPAAKLDIGSGNLNFSSTAQRIRGDFSNATAANRLMIQSNVTNGTTTFGIMPNGTGTVANFAAFGNAVDTANSSVMFIGVSNNGTEVRFNSTISGTGTYLPMTFNTGGSERARIDTSGNLGIGTASPATKLTVYGSSGAAYIQVQDSAGVTGKIQARASTNLLEIGTTSNNGLALYTNNIERALLDSSGNLGIGTSSPVFANGSGIEIERAGAATLRLQDSSTTNSFELYVDSNVHVRGRDSMATIFYTANVERARITSGGDLLVGTTSTTPNPGVGIFPSGFLSVGNNAGSSGFVFQYFVRSATTIGTISQNGTTAVLYNTTSDARLKENITPAPEAGEKIDAIQIVSHDWKSAPDERVEYGVIAQDLHGIAPQAVNAGDNGEEVERAWGVDYSKLVPMLVKELQSVRARLAALESK